MDQLLVNRAPGCGSLPSFWQPESVWSEVRRKASSLQLYSPDMPL